jgi:hypothetical protein
MKKAIGGLAAVGLLLVARRVSHRLSEHSKQMKAHCKEMMATRTGSSDVPSERKVDESKTRTAAAPTA